MSTLLTNYKTLKNKFNNLITQANFIYNGSTNYIESTGAAYIDTGIIPTQNTKIEIRFEFRNINNNDMTIFGGEDTYNTNAFHLYQSGGKFDIGFSTQSFCGSLYDKTIYTLSMSNGNCKLNSNTYTSMSGSINTPNSIYLFALHRSSVITDTNAARRIYYCKLYDGDTLVRDLVPAKDNNDVACFYDKVTKQYFYNIGTGSFTYGTIEYIPPVYIPYTELQYIESNGSSTYINTDITIRELTDTIDFKMSNPYYNNWEYFLCFNGTYFATYNSGNTAGFWHQNIRDDFSGTFATSTPFTINFYNGRCKN